MRVLETYAAPDIDKLWMQMPYGMLALSPDGFIIHWKGKMENWFIFKETDVVRKHLSDVLPLVFSSYESFCRVGQDFWETQIKTPSFSLRGEWKRCYEGGIHTADFLVLRRDDQYFELENIFDTSFDEILVTDGEGRILRAGPKSEQLYGRPIGELLGKKTTELAAEGVFTPSITPEIIRKRTKVSGVQVTVNGKKLHVIGNPVFNPDGSLHRIIFNSREYEEVEMLRQRLETTESLLDAYRLELEKLKQSKDEPQDDMVVLSPEMQQIYQLAERVAHVDSTILIMGESGVGKGMIAQRVHRASHRRTKNFVHINCGAIPDTLIESELFGYEKGAFTGANTSKKGVLEIADGGTVFLDEIGEIPLSVQVKLLQFLQDNTFRRLGGNQLLTVNTRIIAATNQDLHKLIAEGRFREDLFYRLHVIPISVPPLRQRKEEIPALIQHFIARFTKKYGLYKQFHEDTIEILSAYDWPGNVRELENMVERLIVTSEGTEVLPHHLPASLWEDSKNYQAAWAIKIKGLCPLKQAVEEVEKQLISMAYQKYENTYRCAEALKVNQSTIVRKMNKYLGKGKEENR
ncbi:sigma 54-interacting transcriptional regulator [Aneurinibacillus thermoaerophilus]|uniref:HTH-type transcriptional regulatory protein TyrR n=1 Tax=Aneurinibacillus thermoaerophilus TaxID=143495 RepID=A0A1G7XN31_ANETH|nr:sigma 54-interacting transcriptional regulator [Aneurinibacillus thermoaerophilus]MED0737458.1 sigma 54-interacting transcriptional regulator [Aneurinibacillus thermoaerophilus]MED0756309.1 sigma 54-interacting transcriptional regulator [Aneurinibacillus thermoaerophilus]MED0760256.1 sigma 54-interacting transcriptional regulator [Aneurinibacillus thermoaerophilus]MED0765031.1 sigma 54-interacting transcriptional regulator [Aneurinibacillus thermoaerophilus]SDG85605.1 Transcriptional regula